MIIGLQNGANEITVEFRIVSLVLVRRQFRALLDAVERGKDPPGTAYSEADALVRTHAGNFREAAFAESGA